MNIPSAPIEARPRPTYCNVFKTLAQTSIMWAIFLLVLPLAIRSVEDALVSWSLPPVPTWVGWGLFAVLGGTGLYCGFLFATLGQGTPLPLDTTTKFLILGPYRWVRNPMAVCGIGQGVAVGLLMRSPAVVLYSILGAIVWHGLARPWEERDLVRRFGPEYEAYRREVRNWLPRIRPYPKRIQAKAALNEPGSNEAEVDLG